MALKKDSTVLTEDFTKEKSSAMKFIEDSNFVADLWRKTKQKSEELAARRTRFFMNSLIPVDEKRWSRTRSLDRFTSLKHDFKPDNDDLSIIIDDIDETDNPLKKPDMTLSHSMLNDVTNSAMLMIDARQDASTDSSFELKVGTNISEMEITNTVVDQTRNSPSCSSGAAGPEIKNDYSVKYSSDDVLQDSKYISYEDGLKQTADHIVKITIQYALSKVPMNDFTTNKILNNEPEVFNMENFDQPDVLNITHLDDIMDLSNLVTKLLNENECELPSSNASPADNDNDQQCLSEGDGNKSLDLSEKDRRHPIVMSEKFISCAVDLDFDNTCDENQYNLVDDDGNDKKIDETFDDSKSEYLSLENICERDNDNFDDQFITPPQFMSSEQLNDNRLCPDSLTDHLKSGKLNRRRSSVDSGIIVRTPSEKSANGATYIGKSCSGKLYRKQTLKDVLLKGSKSLRNFFRQSNPKVPYTRRSSSPAVLQASSFVEDTKGTTKCQLPELILMNKPNTNLINSTENIRFYQGECEYIPKCIIKKTVQPANKRSVSLNCKRTSVRESNLFSISEYLSKSRRCYSFSCMNDIFNEYNKIRCVDINTNEDLERPEKETKQDFDSIRCEFAISFDVNLRDHNGNSCLHHASSKGDIATIMHLLNSGGDVWQKNTDNLLPIDMALNFTTAKILSQATMFYTDSNRLYPSERNVLGTPKLITEL